MKASRDRIGLIFKFMWAGVLKVDLISKDFNAN